MKFLFEWNCLGLVLLDGMLLGLLVLAGLVSFQQAVGKLLLLCQHFFKRLLLGEKQNLTFRVARLHLNSYLETLD